MKANEENLDLMRRYLTGEADAEAVQTLGERLKTDADLRREFLAYARMDAALASMPVEVVSRPKPTRWRVWAPLAAAAAIIVAAFVALQMPVGERGMPWATLVTSTNAEWADANMDLMLREGELPRGVLRLVAGAVELATPAGARVFLEAPVAVRFVAANRLVCEEGRVLCECPTPQSRLTVETAQTTVVDLGTVFSVEAQKDASTHVAVLSGEVELRGADTRRLRKGEAAVVRSAVVRITPMTEAESSRLAERIATPQQMPSALTNLLTKQWATSADSVRVDAGSQSVRIRAGDRLPFPMAKQTTRMGDYTGRTVLARAWAMSAPEDPMQGRQHAVLKVAFLNAEGREFACSFRHFLQKQRVPGKREQALLAVVAPAGTHGVQFQALMSTAGLEKGAVVFDGLFLGIE